MDIIELLQERFGMMTGKQKKIARFMIQNPEIMCYLSLKELGQQIGCTEVTLLRFCSRIGFDSFGDLKNAFRSRLKEQNTLFRPSSRSEMPISFQEQDKRLRRTVADTFQASSEFFHQFSYEQLAAAAEILLQAERVVLFAEDSVSCSLANILKTYLVRLGIPADSACISNADEVRSCFLHINEDVAAVFFDFPSSSLAVKKVMQNCAQAGCHIISFTGKNTAAVSEKNKIELVCALPDGCPALAISNCIFIIHLILDVLSSALHLQGDFFHAAPLPSVSKKADSVPPPDENSGIRTMTPPPKISDGQANC